MRKVLLTMVCWVFLFSISLSGFCQEQGKDFYVYSDKNSPLNHFIPSGWMGDHNDIKFNDQATDEVATGATSIKITYTAKASQGNKWAGIYWQNKPDNWGDKPGNNYSKKGFSKVTFWAKGETGKEVVEFKSGGISNPNKKFHDSYDETTGRLTLTKEWKKYEIDLEGSDLSSVIGGFCWVASKDFNSQPTIVFYIDNIYFE